MKLAFYPLDIAYKVIDGAPLILIFGRTEKGEKICVVDGFEPYFYAEIENFSVIESIKKLVIDDNGRRLSVKSVELVEKSFLGTKKKLAKILCALPQDVPKLRAAVKNAVKTYEYDIKFTRRYLVDKNIILLARTEIEAKEISLFQGIRCFRLEFIEQSDELIKEKIVLAVDIETYNPLGKQFIPEEHPILMIALYSKNFRKVLTWKRFNSDANVEFLEGEADLLRRFGEIVKEINPDFITGYYSDGFDLPYINTRAKHHKIKLKLGADDSEMQAGDESVSITGILHIDIFKFVKRVFGRALGSSTYKLDDVAEVILGEKKHAVDIENLANTWDNSPELLAEFAKYNLQDAKITYNLFEKVLPNIEELVKIVGLSPFDISRIGFSQLVEWFIIKQLKQYNELIPNKPVAGQISERMNIKYKGAFVFEPVPGIYHDLVIFDFRSLYPTIITSHNISPDVLGCSCCRGMKNQNPELEKIWFCTSRQGFIASVLEDIIRRRMRIKPLLKQYPNDILLKARVDTLKLLANSFYGYLGFYASRWYCLECAETVTAFGRHYIKKVIDEASNNGFRIVYSDTDSIFLTLDGKTKESALKLVENINKELPDLMELEYEGYYPAGIFVSVKEGAYGAKKKYALVNEQGKLKIAGFETVRRNVSIIAKEAQENVLGIVLKENNKEKAIEYIKSVLSGLKERKVENEKVVIYTKLSKEIDDYDSIGPHVAVAKRMKAKGLPAGPGTLIKFIVGEGDGIIRDKARLPEEVEPGKYDGEYYINNQVLPAVEKIFEILGYKKDALLSGARQSYLNKFF
jgi:DNA polymerase I